MHIYLSKLNTIACLLMPSSFSLVCLLNFLRLEEHDSSFLLTWFVHFSYYVGWMDVHPQTGSRIKSQPFSSIYIFSFLIADSPSPTLSNPVVDFTFAALLAYRIQLEL